MPLPPDNLGYPIDETTWGKSIDPLEKENQTEEILNGYITRVIQQWSSQQTVDILLWQEFRDDFDKWTLDLFKTASRGALKALRSYLLTHGVWIRKTSGVSFAKVLHECLDEDTRHEWTKEEIEDHLKLYSNNFNSRWNPAGSQSRTAYQMPSTPQMTQGTAVQPSNAAVNPQSTQDQPISQPRSTINPTTTFDQAPTHGYQ
jgi:hypothetical protein